MEYIIGVDSGGTKTEAIVYDLAGNQLQRVMTGFGNMLVDYEQGLLNIKTAIKTVLLNRATADCRLLVLGLAGMDSGELKAILAEELAAFHVPLVLLNDGQLAHYALLKGEAGILLIAGTGSVSIGRRQKEWYRVGGWGHLFGDEGSAYDIGKCAIQQVLADYDENRPQSLLAKKILQHFQVTTTLELVRVVYGLTKDQLAELAKIVSEAAETDTAARTLLHEAGVKLAIIVEKTVKKMPYSAVVNVGLNGSVIEHNPYVRQAFFEYLRQCSFQCNFIEKGSSSAKGAFYFYLKNGAV
ncbi:ATPase [Erwinia sp. CPCC 100877]|nr:ATPase [Erwinia sp. CPCC 100877]